MILITTYKRSKLLLRLLKELQGEQIICIDDGSDYDPSEHLQYCDYYRTPHRGKQEFWKQWQIMFDIAQESEDDEFIFLQDDLYNVDLEGLRQVETPDKYALNVMDIGPDRGWSPTGYVDCQFKTNRQTLDAIGWFIKPVDKIRWEFRPQMSSGVGQWLSTQFYRNNIPMILPDQNYASHGDAESKMHTDLRKEEPLIAKTTSK